MSASTDVRELSDPWWLEEPHEEGQALEIHSEVEGIPYTVRLVAGRTDARDLGWVGIVDLHIGATVDADVERQRMKWMSTKHDASTPLLSQEVMSRAARAAERTLASFEMTRRTLVAITDQTGMRPGHTAEYRRSEERTIAANIYELTCQVQTEPTPIPFIAAYLDCSERKASDLVKEAREQGLVTSQARRGYAKKTTKRGKK